MLRGPPRRRRSISGMQSTSLCSGRTPQRLLHLRERTYLLESGRPTRGVGCGGMQHRKKLRDAIAFQVRGVGGLGNTYVVPWKANLALVVRFGLLCSLCNRGCVLAKRHRGRREWRRRPGIRHPEELAAPAKTREMVETTVSALLLLDGIYFYIEVRV